MHLEKPFTITEFHDALKLMPNNKSPGLDGFPAEFLKHFWNTLVPVFNRITAETKIQTFHTHDYGYNLSFT